MYVCMYVCSELYRYIATELAYQIYKNPLERYTDDTLQSLPPNSLTHLTKHLGLLRLTYILPR